MESSVPELICKQARFRSEIDEISFFEWLKKIEAVQDIKGVGDEIWLSVSSSAVDDESLRELIAIFSRYKIELSQLSQFKNKSNEDWFYLNKKAFWRKGIFGEQ